MRKNLFFIIIFVLVMGFFVSLPSENSRVSWQKNFSTEEIKYVKLAGQSVKVELAISAREHTLGLSGRPALSADKGMLFIFEKPGRHMFWMQGMKFPIDIVWIAADMKVVDIKKNADPASFPQVFGPDAYAKYVLEIPAGFADKNGLAIGDAVLFTD